MRDVDPRRPTSLQRHPTARSAPPLVLLVLAAFVATCGGPAPSSSATRSHEGGATAIPSAAHVTLDGSPVTPPSSAEPEASDDPGPDAWTAVTGTGIPAVATLTPTRVGRAGVAPDTSFRLTSLDGRSPAVLASHLVSDPPLAFTVASVKGRTAIVRPRTRLAPLTVYRISLERTDGSVEASWAAQAAGPLTVTDTVPGHTSTGVPLDTGIEVTFDQYGIRLSDFRSHFTIRPATTGRFEAADRTVVFVPTKPLRKGTLYTVTVRHGLPLAGTGQVLEKDFIIRFETAAKAPSRISLSFMRLLTDATPRERAVFAIGTDGDGRAPASIPITVHRLAGPREAVAAYRAIGAAPDWTRVSPVRAVATRGLAQVFAGTVPLRHEPNEDWRWFRLPAPLRAGWYVVTERFAGADRQALLQVSDLATFALLATDRTAVWVNDLRTTRPVLGASVTLAGKKLGSTDARGLLVATTPSGQAARADGSTAQMLVVRQGSRALIRPVGEYVDCWYCDWDRGNEAWWRIFSTDRGVYRATDTVHASGMVRNRASGDVPSRVTVSLYADDGDDGEAGTPAIVQVSAQPDGNGAFTVALPIRELPLGLYRVRLQAAGATLGDQWISVDVIVKPAYRLTLATDRAAIVAGTPLIVSADAAFYEGSPLAGTRLAIGDEDAPVIATTDPVGHATATLRPRIGEDGGQWEYQTIGARPTLPEEGDIYGSTSVAVFRGSALLDVGATIAGGGVSITGKVSDVDLGAFDQAPNEDSEVDPRGAPRAGARVALKLTERWTTQRQVGTTYDFILKRVVPRYEDVEHDRVLATRTAETGPDGTFRLVLPISNLNHAYEIDASYTDEAGHELAAGTWAGDDEVDEGWWGAWLANADPANEDNLYSVGQPVRVTFEGEQPTRSADRYLFAVTQLGLRSVSLGTVPAFRTTFTRSSVPSVGIQAVRFTGTGYETAIGTFDAGLRIDDRRLTVSLAPDKPRYEPGGTAVVEVRTLGPNGSPVSATVMVTAIDAKLDAIERATAEAEGTYISSADDQLEELYSTLDSGIIATATSHRTAEDFRGWGYGDTTGGGGDEPRSDFRDWLIAELVRTGADGRARVTVPLSDDLTSWRVSGSAITASLQAGTGSTLVPVGLDFFAEAVLAPEYLASDRPVLRVRSFGTGLAAGQQVTFTVSSGTLNMAPVTRRAEAFEAAEVALPALSVGTHTVRIEATTGSGSTRRTDALERTIRVVETRATQASTTWSKLSGPTRIEVGPGMIGIVLVDAGRGRVVPLLQDLASLQGGRADWELTGALAARVLEDSFGLDPGTTVDADGMDPFVATDENGDPIGISIVRWSSPQLEATALAAMAADPRLEAGQLAGQLHAVYDKTKNRFDRRLLALAGLAALGEPIMVQVRDAATHPGMTVAEQVNLSLAALFAGDEALAGRLARAVLSAHGQRLGAMVRIDPSAAPDADLLTARLAIVTASLGDPVAAGMDAWVAGHPPATTTVDLERALAARGWARRVAGAEAAVAVTIDGNRRVVRVLPGEPARLSLTPAQARSTTLAPVSGDVLVVQTWRTPLDPGSLTPLSGQSLERIVQPAGIIGPASTVVVRLRVTLGPDAGDDCWTVTDLLPSGLAPIVGHRPWVDEDGVGTWSESYPDRAEGQRVEFCVTRNPHQSVRELRYLARVVSPGTYTWEPAVLQSEQMPERGLVIGPVSVTVAGTGS